MYRNRLAFALAMAALAAILLPSSLLAQITFQRTYGGTNYDEGYSVRQTADGGYIIAGRTDSYGQGLENVYLVKTDAHGETLWTGTYGGRGDAGGVALPAPDSGYLFAGTASGAGEDVYLVRTNARGDTLWTRELGGYAGDRANSAVVAPDGAYVVAGETWSFGGAEQVYVVKTNDRGDTLWTRVYGQDSSSEFGFSIGLTRDGGYIISAGSNPGVVGAVDIYLIRVDSTGDTLWTRMYGSGGTDLGVACQETENGDFIVAGSTTAPGTEHPDVYLVRTNAHGETLWTRTYGGPDDDWGNSVLQTTDGGFLVAGGTRSYGTGSADVFLVKTNAVGDTEWTRTFGGHRGEWANSVRQTSDGGYVCVGSTSSYGAGLADVYLIKTDSLGNVAVAEPNASPTRAAALSLTCEPNPCRGRTAISLQLTANSPAEVAIFDASGRRVRTLTVNRTPCTVWDGKDDVRQPLPSGAYFVRLDAAGRHATARLVLQR